MFGVNKTSLLKDESSKRLIQSGLTMNPRSKSPETSYKVTHRSPKLNKPPINNTVFRPVSAMISMPKNESLLRGLAMKDMKSAKKLHGDKLSHARISRAKLL